MSEPSSFRREAVRRAFADHLGVGGCWPAAALPGAGA